MDTPLTLHSAPEPFTGRASFVGRASPVRVTISSVATAVPPHKIEQDAFLEMALDVAPEFRNYSPLFTNTGIANRYSVVPLEWMPERHGWLDRSAIFVEQALALLETVARDCLAKADLTATDLDALVVASSTGLAVPTLDARLANRLGMKPTLERLPLFGLGCAAGVTGLARAVQLARAKPGSKVLFLCVELCTINGRIQDHRMVNFISAALFGDGAAGVLVTSDHGESDDGGHGHGTILASGEHQWNGTEDLMGWSIEEDGFGVIVSPEIPRVARDRMRPVIDAFLAGNGLGHGDIAGFVLHPGGRKVLESAETALNVPRDALQHSWDVLRDFGNMSSPTVLFVLERTLAQKPKGKYILVALGPGFTISLLLVDFN